MRATNAAPLTGELNDTGGTPNSGDSDSATGGREPLVRPCWDHQGLYCDLAVSRLQIKLDASQTTRAFAPWRHSSNVVLEL
jgi:hypothetical protein